MLLAPQYPRGCAQVYLSGLMEHPIAYTDLSCASQWVSHWIDHLELGVVFEGLHFLQCRKLLRRVVKHFPNRHQYCKDFLQTWQTSSSWNAAKLKNMCPTVNKQCLWCNMQIHIWTPFFLPEKVAALSYPCPLSFPASVSLSARKAFSAANIEAASQAERLTSPRKWSTGEPELPTHLKHIKAHQLLLYLSTHQQVLNRMQLL